MNKIEHIGIAVKNLKDSNKLFETLFGKPQYKIESVVSEGVNTSFFMIGDQKIELLVSDNGIGYNPDDINEGLGTKLVGMYSKQLNGKFEKLDQKGTGYKLVFKNG